MPRRKQVYQDKEIIYREGDPADGAYEVLSGSVELSRESASVNKTESFKVGEMFGEMGLIGGETRESTARAIGPVQLRLIHRDASAYQSEDAEGTGAISRLMGKMSDNTVSEPLPVRSTLSSDGIGFIQRMADLMHPVAGRIMVRVAQFSGDQSGAVTRAVISSLEKRKGISARGISQPLEINFTNDLSTEYERVGKIARRWLREQNADILIWGHLPPSGVTVHIHFISLVPWDERVPGCFDLTTDLPLPSKFDGSFADFLHAVTLSATVTVSAEKAHMRISGILEATAAVESAMDEIPLDIPERERAALYLCYGNILSSVWSALRTPELMEKAILAYRQVKSSPDIDEPSIDWAVAQKHLSILIYLRAETQKDMTVYEESAASALSALELFTKDETPYEWATLQHRLGLIHYTLGYEAGHTGALRQALRCHQNAMKVYSKRLHTARWSEVMSSFARAAQAFGEHTKSLEAMATAVNAYFAVLQVRDDKKAPLAWAATQNNLGSALFSLGKKAKNPRRILAAIDSFEAALAIYTRKNRKREGEITGKNLDHARKLLEDMGPVELQKNILVKLDPPASVGLSSELLEVEEADSDFNGGSIIH